MSSIAATLWFLYPDSYEERLNPLKPYFFKEIEPNIFEISRGVWVRESDKLSLAQRRKGRQGSIPSVTPAKAGVHALDSRLRGNDLCALGELGAKKFVDPVE